MQKCQIHRTTREKRTPMIEKKKDTPRKRLTLLCSECRRRKVKCDRRLPCLTCVHNLTSTRCSYFGDQIATSTGSSNAYTYDLLNHQHGRLHWRHSTASSFTEKGHNINRPQVPPDFIDNRENHHVFAGPPPGPATVTFVQNNHVYPSHGVVPYQGEYYATGSLIPPQPLVQMPIYQNPVYQMLGPLFYPVKQSDLVSMPPINTGISLHIPLSVDEIGPPQHTVPTSTGFSQNGPLNATTDASWKRSDQSHSNNEIGREEETPPEQQVESQMEVHPTSHAIKHINLHTAARYFSVQSLLNEESPLLLVMHLWLGENPYDILDPDEKFDLFEGYSLVYAGENGSCVSHGPFSWYAYAFKDVVLHSICLCLKAIHDSDPKAEVPSMVKDFDSSSIRAHIKNTPEALPQDGPQVGLKRRSVSRALTFHEDEVEPSINLADRIKLLLPSKKSVSFYVDYFFEAVYPHLPVLDEDHFREQIQRILAPFSFADEPYTEIHATKPYDIASLGILLVLLRMSYLCSLSVQKYEKGGPDDVRSMTEQSRFILTHPVHVNAIECAQLCLNHYSLHQTANMTVLQCAVMIRTYLHFAPESSDAVDGHEENSYNVMCINMAYCMGLNRDPVGHNGTSNTSGDHLRRKLWHFIKFLDTRMACHFGSPIMVDDRSNDTKAPFYSPGCSNVADESLEQAACEGMQIVASLTDKARVILSKCTDLKTPLQVQGLTELLSEFESSISSEIGSLPDLMESPSHSVILSYKKVHLVRLYLIMKSFLLAIFYHLFLNYEKRKRFDISYFYLRKFVSISCGEFLVQALSLMERGTHPRLNCCGGGLLNPMLVFMLQKTNHLNLRLVVQLNCMGLEIERATTELDTESGTKLALLRKLASLVGKFVKFSNCCLLRLGSRFVYSSKLSKIHSALLEVATSKRSQQFEAKKLEFMPLTQHQTKELLEVAESVWTKIKNQGAGGPKQAYKQGLTGPHAEKTQHPSANSSSSTLGGSGVSKSEANLSMTDSPADIFARQADPAYETVESRGTSDSLLATDLANLDLENLRDIEGMWLRLDTLEKRDGLHNTPAS